MCYYFLICGCHKNDCVLWLKIVDIVYYISIGKTLYSGFRFIGPDPFEGILTQLSSGPD